MKLLHVTSCRELSAGQRKQLRYEQTAAARIDGIVWKIVAFQVHPPKDAFEKQYPRFFRPLFLRNLYLWLFLLREHSRYDVVMMRHMTFDPFLLVFGFLIPNRFTVHHSKEIEELKLIRRNWKGKAASMVERITGFVNSRQVKGVLGVTREIADYQISIHKAKCLAGFYPNGIDTHQVTLLEDRRDSSIHVAFMCGRFTPWHGLDRLIEAAIVADANLSEPDITVHLIGTVDAKELRSIIQLDLKNIMFISYGHLSYAKYREILSKCDIGLGSLAMDRQNLSEGAILKVREYLASGLPVYSGCNDTAIPKQFPYYLKGPVNFAHIIAYARDMKRFSRAQIREASDAYIQKYNIMIKLRDWMEKNTR